jgi:alpha-galactosidase
VRLRGLDPARRYRVREVDLAPGARSRLAEDGKIVGGATLMTRGLTSPLRRPIESAVILLMDEK